MAPGLSRCFMVYFGISSRCWRGAFPGISGSGSGATSCGKNRMTSAFSVTVSSDGSQMRRRRYSASQIPTDENLFDEQTKNALSAVRKACEVTTKLQSLVLKSTSSSSMTKTDDSPVTIADFASQATVLQFLEGKYPEDKFLAEENSDNLTPTLMDQILQASGIADEMELKRCIDLGKTACLGSGSSRFWCLDPIDGTKGFLRNEQYCVALALIENGVPVIGVLACPKLKQSHENQKMGCIFLALRGRGCYELSMEPGDHPPILISSRGDNAESEDTSTARFCVGVETNFGDPDGRIKAMACLLHGTLDHQNEILYACKMDSQGKYGVVARGDAEFYVRLPKRDHRDWIWDVAPGALVLEEVGGIVTDSEGSPLDFSTGSKLSSNGILGAVSPRLHESLLEAYRRSAS